MTTKSSAMFEPLNGINVEAQDKRPKQGGWITFPFIAGNILTTTLAASGATGNLIVYLIKEFNMSSVQAAQINNIINGCINLTPIAGAIVSDAFFGSYPVIVISSFINILAMSLFTLTSTIRSFRPPRCNTNVASCEPASAGQLALLYSALALLGVGAGGARYNTMTMGAEQFELSDHREIFFNWAFVITYVSAIIGSTVVVYVEDSLSWGLGFGICTVLNAGGLAVLLAGTRYYCRPKARGSPFTRLVRVVVAAVWKSGAAPSSAGSGNYYCGVGNGVIKSDDRSPSQTLRFLNQAAVIEEGDVCPDGSVARPWRLCSVEQVEDLKILLRLFPLWSSSIMLSVPIGIQFSLSVLQSLSMDRSLGPRFSLPAGSITVANLAAVAISLPIIDRLIMPHFHRRFTPIHRIGTGHILNVAGMAASALVDRRRLEIIRTNAAISPGAGWVSPMSTMWLVLPLAVSGVGEALHFPGQVSLYYQEFPKSLRSTATAIIALLIAIGFYLSTAVIDLIRRTTSWLPDNVNQARIDNVFWMLTVAGLINFGYYVVCAAFYRHRSMADISHAESNNSSASQ